MNNNLKTTLIAVSASVATFLGAQAISKSYGGDKDINFSTQGKSDSMVSFANLPAGKPGDFTYAAEISSPSVVHIKATSTRTVNQRRPSSIFDFFGFDEEMYGQPQPRNQEATSSGSGVIISNDGYIVTNNHVVENTSTLEVITHNKKVYKAEIVGRDPSTDIAVIKVDAKELPAISFANSDNVRIGEWVLAVGNPFNLESTVTAGIISAIGRNINILGQKQQRNPFSRNNNNNEEPINPIESFIQTDAAINPGNSGGALVNLNGELIGINTAIASPNGAYAGYAFAVPSGIVKKVSTDLIKHGNVQRGYIGAAVVELDSKIAKELEVKNESGIYLGEVTVGGASEKAGLKKGDVIIKADGIETTSNAKFLELIGRKRPGEKVNLVVDRNGSIKTFAVTLLDTPDGKAKVKVDTSSPFGKMGVELEELSSKQLSDLGVKSGVKIKSIRQGGLLSNNTNFEKGFIITSIGNRQVKTSKEVQQIIESAYENGEEGVLICGFYPGGSRGCDGISIR